MNARNREFAITDSVTTLQGVLYALVRRGTIWLRTVNAVSVNITIHHKTTFNESFIFALCFIHYCFMLDHDECEKNGMCANGKCLNVQGSFQCHCKSGFVMSKTGYSCIGNLFLSTIIITL